MTTLQPDERTIYVALRNVFAGGDAQPRAIKKIRERIRAQNSAELEALVREYNIDNVSNVAKRLLEKEIFQSTLKAKLRFPELFEVSPAQSAARTVSEQEAARAEEVSLRKATEAPQESKDLERTRGNSSGLAGAIAIRKTSQGDIRTRVPSLYPVYLPMRTQHVLMSKLQTVLEKACFNFGLNQVPQVLEGKGWSCAECVELNVWQKILINAENQMSTEAVETIGKPLPDLLANIAQIRHTAVHRLPVTVVRVQNFLIDAMSLTKLLGDNVHGEIVSHLRCKTESVVEEIKRYKDLLEARSADAMRRIRRQQAELDREIQTTIDNMLQEDKSFQLTKGKILEQAILSMELDYSFHSSEPDEEPAERHLPECGEIQKECDDLSDSNNLA